MQNNYHINQKIRISQSHKLSPKEITNNIGKEAIIKGFKNINNEDIMPIIEFQNHKRMWLFYEEIHEFQNSKK